MRAVMLRSPSRTRLDLALLVAVPLASLGIGAAVVWKPTLAMLPVAALGAALLLTDGRARTVFILFGGIFILQRPGDLDLLKMGFLAGAAVAFAGAYLNVRNMRETDVYRISRPLLSVSAAFFALAALSLPVAYTGATPPVVWLRDVAPYLLFASAPIFALDAQASLSAKNILRLLVAFGLIGAVAFAVTWLERRAIASFTITRLGLASAYLPASLYAYAMAVTLQGRMRRARWFFLAAILLALLLTTGTRSTLALLAAPVAIVFASRREFAVRSVRLTALGPLAIAVTLLLAIVVVGVSGANQEYLQDRIAIFKSSGDSEDDLSYQDRVAQTRVAWTVFKANPLVGSGPGTLFEWTRHNNERAESFVLDTPLTFVAKFGLLGIAAFVFLVLSYLSFVRRLTPRGTPTLPYLALTGYLAVVAALAVFAPPFDDKGFSFALVLVFALALADARRRATEAAAEPSSTGGARLSPSGSRRVSGSGR